MTVEIQKSFQDVKHFTHLGKYENSMLSLNVFVPFSSILSHPSENREMTTTSCSGTSLRIPGTPLEEGEMPTGEDSVQVFLLPSLKLLSASLTLLSLQTSTHLSYRKSIPSLCIISHNLQLFHECRNMVDTILSSLY